jgi:type IV pilus assembly protein PilW
MLKNIHTKPRQLGATLIEIMIAMLIGLFLLGGLIQIFSGSKQTYRLQDNMSRLQENGRFAMDFITRDVRMTDYWGCVMDAPAGTPSGISGTDNAGINSSDSIILVGASNAIPVLANQTTVTSDISIASGSGLSQNEMVLIADCSKAEVFQITNDDPSLSSGTIQHAALSKRYTTDASIYSMSTITYSIQIGVGGLPGLFRQDNGGAAQELIENIENMQILYGVDSDASGTPGFGTPNYYEDATAVGGNMNQVVSVRINLLAITPDDFVAPNAVDYTYNGTTTTPTDSRLRREFSTTIALRNRLR